MTDLTPSCCGRPMRRMDIETPEGRLGLLVCGRCETNRWTLGARALSLREALRLMATVPRRAGGRRSAA